MTLDPISAEKDSRGFRTASTEIAVVGRLQRQELSPGVHKYQFIPADKNVAFKLKVNGNDLSSGQ